MPPWRRKSFGASYSLSLGNVAVLNVFDADLKRSTSPNMGFPDDKVYKKLDYPTIAKALRPAAEGTESFRSQRSRPSSGKTGSSSIAVNGERFVFDTSPTIRTIRAPLSVDEGLTSSSKHSADFAITEEDIDGEGRKAADILVSSTKPGIDQLIPLSDDDKEDDIIKYSPTILKRGMALPAQWNVPQGTVVLIDKPKGWTSFLVCDKIRKLVKVKKVGHAGTLDPMATGLLVVCVGPATKLADKYQALRKVYTGTFRLGEATSSYDAESLVNERKPWEHITDTQIQATKETFLGEIMQIPPMFSAIKIDGQRMYEKARQGEHIDIPARKVKIYDFYVERNTKNRQEVDFLVRCSKGTYIRSLCADFARALNSCAHLTSLRREKTGILSVNEAWTMEDLADACSSLYRKPNPDL